MANHIGTFPFGQPILPVIQKDQSPKNIFILGVYASAVHARWVGDDGRTRINALGVASEPEIFWRGDSVEELIGAIDLPEGAGRLEPAGKQLNGPSGLALDESFLEPLGLSRDDAWLCDLVPHSCMNPNQQKAIEERYLPEKTRLKLPEPQWPPVPQCLATPSRREEICEEIERARAGVLIALGDQPLKSFLSHFGSHDRLKDYGVTPETYGQLHPIHIQGRDIQLLPLVHPRQAGKLGIHSSKWYDLHDQWVRNVAGIIL